MTEDDNSLDYSTTLVRRLRSPGRGLWHAYAGSFQISTRWFDAFVYYFTMHVVDPSCKPDMQ